MDRPKRIHRRNYNEPGHAHVLTFSCYRGFKFLAAERTSQWLAESIDAARQSLDFALWAYVFMPEHAHIIVWPRRPAYNVADIRHAIKAPVARRAIRYIESDAPEWLTRITRIRGGKQERLFWQSGGGFDRNIDQPTALEKEIDYLHMNPVKQGLCQIASDWKWSSAGSFIGLETSPLPLDPIPADWFA